MSADTAFEVGRLFEPLSAIANVLTASQKDVFIRLPGLEAYFPMSLVGSIGSSRNHAEGVDLLQQGTCVAGYDGNSYRQLGLGTNFLFTSSTQLELTGTESFIDSALRGWTIGGWFHLDSLPSTESGLITKAGPVPDFGYAMGVTSTGQFKASVSSTGAAVFTVTSAAFSTVDVWRFIVSRFIPSTELAIFVDGDKTANTTAIPASTFQAAQQFDVGRQSNSNSRIPDARVRDVFVSRVALSDALIEEVRQSSQP